MARSVRPLVVCFAGLAAITVGSTLSAHSDDPKGKEKTPKYVGPGYRAALAGPLGAGGEFASEGVQLGTWLPIGDFAGSHDNANDCWGYVSPSGREYAILGLERGNGFVEITDPDNANVIATIPGPASLWGDIKVYGHHVYAVTEDSLTGIQVIDVSDIDNGNVVLVNEIEKNVGTGKSHNIVIDEVSGFLYRVGGTYYGMAAYDLNQDPVNPPKVGEWTDRYIHDMQVVTYTDGPYSGRQIAFTCGGDNGGWQNTGLEIVDVTDKTDMFSVTRFLYENGVYSHQVWLTGDNQYAYLNDELDEGTNGITTNTKIINVSDIENPVELPSYTNGSDATGHNLYVSGDLVFEANYTSGLRVFDISDRENPSEVGYFDTFPDNDDAGYSGLWSTYPFFPSGTVIGSDRQRGLFVLKVDAVETCPNDLDDSGRIDFGDLLVVLDRWGDSDDPADLDGSGMVDFGDVLIILESWGDLCP